MWGAITNIFGRKSTNESVDNKDAGQSVGVTAACNLDEMDDTFGARQAKQRASIKWLLAKAFNNNVPETLKQPFYKDYENQEHLKPQIVGALANCELYCFALGNIYSDPSYHNLNHSSILQTLSRKGVLPDVPLTETALIQTNPPRMSAHMAVIEAIMHLYAKEVITPDRVLAAVQRFSYGRKTSPSMPTDYEDGVFLWISHACDALKQRIEQDLESEPSGGRGDDKFKPPEFRIIKKLKDISDGVALAALISYYCPAELPWTEIRISPVPTVQDSLYNLHLVQQFCNRCLPAVVFHVTPEDITYMQESMKQNLFVFLADLFNLIEINPAKCVRYPGMDKFSNEKFPQRNEHGVMHKRHLIQTVVVPIPDLRSGLDDLSTPTTFQVSLAGSSHQPLRRTSSQTSQNLSETSNGTSSRCDTEDSFVVHKGKNIPTLSSIIHDNDTGTSSVNQRSKSARERSFIEQRDDMNAAGKPSNWEENRRSTFAGRRSRRNSMSDDSQLTIENFGGSQDNINFIGRNIEKEVGVHVGRKISAPTFPTETVAAARSSIQDARSSIQLGYQNGCEEKQDNGTEKPLRRQMSSDSIALRHRENVEVPEDKTNFIDMYSNKENVVESKPNGKSVEKKTTFAMLPNTTTWQQQSSQHQQHDEGMGGSDMIDNSSNAVNSAQLLDVRLKLEEKRRLIESEKRKNEMVVNKQRRKVGEAAFLQAVAKGKGNLLKSSVEAESSPNATMVAEPKHSPSHTIVTPQKQYFQDESNTSGLGTDDERLDGGNVELDQYKKSLVEVNCSLNDIQNDIQRIASQQSQLQAAQQQSLIAQQQKQIHALQQQQQQYQHSPPPPYQPQPYPAQPMYPNIYQPQQQQVYASTIQTSMSAPHIPQYLAQQQQQQSQFFLHDYPNQNVVVPQRRTWAQPPVQQPQRTYEPKTTTWDRSDTPPNPATFLLHPSESQYQDSYYDNGRHNGESSGFTLSQLHLQQQQKYGTAHSTPSASPQHQLHHRQSLLMDDGRKSYTDLAQIGEPRSKLHTPIPAPDDMEPQNISFIGNANTNHLSEGLSKLNITSGSRTYRIPSPTRPVLAKNTFQVAKLPVAKEKSFSSESDDTGNNKKGFYISFDNDQPKRPKPMLRKKRTSPKTERVQNDNVEENEEAKREAEENRRREELRLKREAEEEKAREKADYEDREKPQPTSRFATSQRNAKVEAASAIIIGNDLSNPDPQEVDEREKKKERIMLLSLQRRQEQEEAKARKEAEAQARRDKERAKEEEKLRKKEEQAARRAAILEQYKLKKAMEEAEREGKVFDKSEFVTTMKPAPKMRPKAPARPRPKTIHIDSGSVEMAEGMLQSSRGKKGSNFNLTANSSHSSHTKRDYFRGSQDSLADRSMSSGLLYRDSPDDSRGISPCQSASQTLRRQSSYKTSRDPSPVQVRGRPKYTNYQNFKGRKSNSLMNLYGSSIDQDSLAYRYGDTDSGLGRATPPRRAPSPGMGSMRHLTSPSGPGSLPGFMGKPRRVFDDGSSDISSTPSSMMDYTGPRLYKQPTTKSNRGIILNAVEYCVFPGVVNREAKKRVLEEVNRSESKHFLILFRDAGCQFRALYSYCPDREEVLKLYGTGPKQVNDRMFDKFFKYNSGGKCFSQVHTKHLTVTIDAFTIHNSLWQGKKVNLPNKKEMALVI